MNNIPSMFFQYKINIVRLDTLCNCNEERKTLRLIRIRIKEKYVSIDMLMFNKRSKKIRMQQSISIPRSFLLLLFSFFNTQLIQNMNKNTFPRTFI